MSVCAANCLSIPFFGRRNMLPSSWIIRNEAPDRVAKRRPNRPGKRLQVALGWTIDFDGEFDADVPVKWRGKKPLDGVPRSRYRTTLKQVSILCPFDTFHRQSRLPVEEMSTTCWHLLYSGRLLRHQVDFEPMNVSPTNQMRWWPIARGKSLRQSGNSVWSILVAVAKVREGFGAIYHQAMEADSLRPKRVVPVKSENRIFRWISMTISMMKVPVRVGQRYDGIVTEMIRCWPVMPCWMGTSVDRMKGTMNPVHRAEESVLATESKSHQVLGQLWSIVQPIQQATLM